MNNHPRVKALKGSLRHALAITAGLAWSCMVMAQQEFPTPEKAAEAFVEALGTEHADQKRLTELLGNEWRNFIPREGAERKDVDAFLKQYHEQHQIEKTSDNKAILSVGNDHWTLPIPIIKVANRWRFDVKAGNAEVRARQIGRNELAAVQSALAYHDAQMDYASVDRDGDGALEYAQKIFSTPASTTDSIGRTTIAGRSARWGPRSAKPLPAKTGMVTASASSMAKALQHRAAPTATSSVTR